VEDVAPPDRPEAVRAAGGIVWREVGDEIEVLLVHRPAYDDWTFPKGKAAAGESNEACALREVEEETGLTCALEGELGETSYVDPKGRHKLVRWYSMRPLGGAFTADHEVDEIRWLPLAEAAAALTYPRDRELLAAFESR
jgi:8-oxo-dGTP diphosphatase